MGGTITTSAVPFIQLFRQYFGDKSFLLGGMNRENQGCFTGVTMSRFNWVDEFCVAFLGILSRLHLYLTKTSNDVFYTLYTS